MKPYTPLDSDDRYFPIYISREFMYPSLFCIYLVLIGFSFVVGLCFAAMLLHNRQTFHFSFHLILLQIIWCGIAKCLIRAISTSEFEGSTYLYAIELMFDFGLLLFILSMAFNRFFVVFTPSHCFIYTNKLLQCLFVLIIWIVSTCVMLVFITPQCLRQMYEDGRLMDSCTDLYKEDFNDYGSLTPIVFLIRKAVYLCYDILPLSCLLLYAIATIALFQKRRFLSQTRRHSEWKVLLHGVLVFAVYGVATVINYVLTLHERDEFTGFVAQLLMFVYVSLDVTTVLCIPLSIFLTVPALRQYPSTIIRRCMKHNDSRVFSIHRSMSPRPSPAPPIVLQTRRVTVASIRFRS